LQEASPDVAAKLGALDKTYPYKFLAPKPVAFAWQFQQNSIQTKEASFLPDSWNEYTEITFVTPVKKTLVHFNRTTYNPTNG